jgi:prepilin-type N-terminal cleavage/methylation domain-containing protein
MGREGGKGLAGSAGKGSKGFTLLEVIVGLVVSSLLVLGATRFFNDSNRSFNLQERLVERNQNAQYVLKHLEERFMEAGANLPEEACAVIVPFPGQDVGFTMTVNPRGGVQAMYADLLPTLSVPVDEWNAFRAASTVLLVHADKNLAAEELAIATDYNQGGFVNGLKEGAGAQDSIRLRVAKAFKYGDILYACARHEFALTGDKLTMDGMELAENIQGLDLAFLGQDGTPTKDWKQMRSARLMVKVKTASPAQADSTAPFHSVALSSEVRMRNR